MKDKKRVKANLLDRSRLPKADDITAHISPSQEETPEPNKSVRKAEQINSTERSSETSESRTPASSVVVHQPQQRAKRDIFAELEADDIPPPRSLKRQSYEMWQDQIQWLDQLADTYKRKKGVKLSISSVIRDALDEYIEKHGGRLQ